MRPAELIQRLKERKIDAAYLFIGAEPFRKRQCRAALLRALAGGEQAEVELVRRDLQEDSLDAILDDARSLSLFTPRRLIWVESAEALAGKRSESTDSARQLAQYLRVASPSVVIVFDAGRYELDYEGRKRYESILKCYQPLVPSAVVEFPALTVEEATSLANQLAQRAGLKIGPEEIALLVESAGTDGLRIAMEIEKLRLRTRSTEPVTPRLIADLVPSAPAATIFELVQAVGLRQRQRALQLLHTLAETGEYLPLALGFLEAQLRYALVAREAGLESPQRILTYLQQLGVRIWLKRAEEIAETARLFQKEELQWALERIYEADKALRDARPDDRVVLERLVLELTAPRAPLA